MVGSITIDGHGGTDRAHLRWFIAEPGITGRGFGASLMEAAMAFCRGRAYSSVWLTTFARLDAARKLYDRIASLNVGHFGRPIGISPSPCRNSIAASDRAASHKRYSLFAAALLYVTLD